MIADVSVGVDVEHCYCHRCQVLYVFRIIVIVEYLAFCLLGMNVASHNFCTE